MLRISEMQMDGKPCLKLEGRLVGPWVEELRTQAAALQSVRPGLDLAEVSFVDSAGLHLLNDLIGGGFPLHAQSSFVAELLRPRNAQ